MTEIEIRALKTFDEMGAVVELQKSYWGSEMDALVPAHMLFSIVTSGGHVLAAFDDNRMIGVVIGLFGTNPYITDRPAAANLLIASKRMVVLPEYRNFGVGYQLKLAQREAAIRQGVRLVTWTYDPLLAVNAHFNLHKLGGLCREYLVDYYGTDPSSGLVTLGTSDRFLVEWWVMNRQVGERLSGMRAVPALAHYLKMGVNILNCASPSGDLLYPACQLESPVGDFALVEIPLNYAYLTAHAPALAAEWRLHTRHLFAELKQSGYLVTDFLRGTLEGRECAFYLLSGAATETDLALN